MRVEMATSTAVTTVATGQQWGGRDDGWKGVDAPDRAAGDRARTADGRPSTFDGDSLSSQAREASREAGAAAGQRDRTGSADRSIGERWTS